jgi:hypothetical protein
MKTFEEVSKNIDIFMDGRYKSINNMKFDGHIYLFGIWSGCSTKLISDHVIKCDYHNVIYGFDSFTGLPKETDNISKYPNFTIGNYSSCDLYDEPDVKKVMDELKRGINNDKLKLYDGFYDSVLTKELIESENMRPASYVDIDVDLHCSTATVLEWMLDNKLIVKGTIIYFDDWGSTKEYAGGESLAWKQAVKKYGIEYKEIYSLKMGESVLKAMEVLCVNG